MTDKISSILVVDDDQDILNFIEKDLNSKNFKVFSVNSIEKAIEQLSDNKFDIAFLDIVMGPDKSSEKIIEIQRKALKDAMAEVEIDAKDKDNSFVWTRTEGTKTKTSSVNRIHAHSRYTDVVKDFQRDHNTARGNFYERLIEKILNDEIPSGDDLGVNTDKSIPEPLINTTLLRARPVTRNKVSRSSGF